jgi:hypothetical protein
MGIASKIADKVIDRGLEEVGLKPKQNPNQVHPQQAVVVNQQYQQPYQQPVQQQPVRYAPQPAPVPQQSAGMMVAGAVAGAALGAALGEQHPINIQPQAPMPPQPPPTVWCVAMRRRPANGEPVHESELPPINRNYRCCCKCILYPPVSTLWFLGHLWTWLLYLLACCGCCICPEGAGQVSQAMLNNHQHQNPEIAKQQGRELAQRSHGCVKYLVNCTRCTYTNFIVPCWILNAWGDEDPDTIEDCGNCCTNCC